MCCSSYTPLSLTACCGINQGTCSLLELKRPFEFKLVRIENVKLSHNDTNEESSSSSSTSTSSYLYLEAGLYHGGELLSPVIYSQSIPTCENPTWIEWLRFETLMCDLPKVCFSL
jgi:hypothetical protein